MLFPQTKPAIGRTFLSLSVLVAATVSNASGASTTKPNVVIILADDQGWGDLSVNGNTNLSTPNVDSLARTGVSFNNFYVCPVCSPTRAEFLTGRYHPRCGVSGVSEGAERLNPDERTIADVFKNAGYSTGAFGKWHNGSQWPYHPNARGFEEFYGFTHGHWGTYFDAPLEHNGNPVKSKGYLCDDLTDHAISFIEQHKDTPFFCFVPFNTPHSPMQVTERFYKKFADLELPLRAKTPEKEDLQFTKAALAMCENIDWNVGRILKRLDDLHLSENTIVLYFSDNGPNSPRWNGRMKGIKGSTDEGGVRSPLMIRWPSKLPAGTTVSKIAGAIDLFPTLADLAGIPAPNTKPLDGVCLSPLLLGKTENWPERLIFSHWGGKVSVRSQQYRQDAQQRLFDMEADPEQENDLSSKLKTEANHLSNAASKWRDEVLKDLKGKERPYTVGYPDFPNTELPARDGIPHGSVQRSAKAPNCSYFKNWMTTEDSITWNIEVATTGKYEATVHYTCPATDLGSTVELSFNGNRIEGKVSEANDPPELGAENDRVPRIGHGESYVKNFKPFRLGVMTLTSGQGLLTLRAPVVAGKQVMDVEGITLTLLPPR